MPASRVPLPFTVAIPIPRLDRYGKKVPLKSVEHWKDRALLVLGECFGGSMAIRSPGPYHHQDGTVVFDQDQWIVQSGCSGREAYLEHREKIETFAEEMGDALKQEAVFVLACSLGESALLFLDDPGAST